METFAPYFRYVLIFVSVVLAAMPVVIATRLMVGALLGRGKLEMHYKLPNGKLVVEYADAEDLASVQEFLERRRKIRELAMEHLREPVEPQSDEVASAR